MIKQSFPLDFQWPTQEPFLFCVHHNDLFPKGLPNLGPDKKYLKGRNMGSDFELKDGFRMYHGEEIPGFPVHPHRGFETITIVRKGLVDHADSLGAAGRYGDGDVQWMTAGAGVQHSEMMPLLHQDRENPIELFQIWLNLPKINKMAQPIYKMFWHEQIPHIKLNDGKVIIQIIAGEYKGTKALIPPHNSWAYDPVNETSILLVKMKAGTELKLPASKSKTARSLYFFSGKGLILNEKPLNALTGHYLESQFEMDFKSTSEEIEFLILQSRPIGEPIYQHGPFVMNTREEIVKAFQDFQQTSFGGWPWPRPDMVHGNKKERFAKFPEGHTEHPPKSAKHTK